jgi:hypothetical protein
MTQRFHRRIVRYANQPWDFGASARFAHKEYSAIISHFAVLPSTHVFFWFRPKKVGSSQQYRTFPTQKGHSHWLTADGMQFQAHSVYGMDGNSTHEFSKACGYTFTLF